LFSIAFFIAQALNVVGSTESVKTVSASYTQIAKNDFQPLKSAIEKPPLINSSPQWRNFSPQLESILQLFNFAKTYFVLCALLLVFTVSQFVCYVFYIKQRPDFVFYSKFLARCFKNLSLYLQRFRVQIHFSFFNLNSKGDFYAYSFV